MVVLSARSQEIKYCRLHDNTSNEPIPQAHIQNLTQQKFTVSSFTGEFRIPMELGDSIWISCVGYQSTGFIIAREWADTNDLIIKMERDTILLDEVIIARLPPEYVFKERILKYQPENDSVIEFHGVQKAADYDNPLLLDQHVKSIGFALRHPFGFIYHNTSKKEKEKRKLYKIEKSRFRSYEIDQKYNREYVSALTKLDGDDLTNFMMFCDFSEDFLYRSTQFEIGRAVLAKLADFQKEIGGAEYPG